MVKNSTSWSDKFKYLDMFGYPVRLRTSGSTIHNHNEVLYKSCPGACLSLVVIIVVFFRFVVEIEALMSNSDDEFLSKLQENNFEVDDGNNNIDINQFSFMPSMEIRLMRDKELNSFATKFGSKNDADSKDYDISHKIDAAFILDYLSIQLKVRNIKNG